MALGLVAGVGGATQTWAKATPKVPKAKVILIGLDGVSLNVLEPLARSGATPVMAKLLEQGARGELASFWPLRTPQVWTAMVTGKLPGQHGIWDHVSDTYFVPPPYREEPRRRITTADRRSKALWQLLSQAGKSSLVVGWMASWPAEQVKHATIVAPVELLGDKRQTTIKGSFWRHTEGIVAPSSRLPLVHRTLVEPEEVPADALEPFADIPPEDSPLMAMPYIRRYVYGLRWSLARARSVERLTMALAPHAQAEVVLAYFQCSDSLLHRFWVFHKSVQEIQARLEHHGIPGSEHAAELKSRFGRVVRACYEDLDARVGRLLKRLRGPDTLVLIASDHGFGDPDGPHKLKDEPYSGYHRDNGILVAAGPHIKAGSRVDGHSVLDITPTILHHLGLPVARDMRGKPIAAIGQGPHSAKAKPNAVRWIDTYEAKPQLEVPYAEGWPPRPSAPASP